MDVITRITAVPSMTATTDIINVLVNIVFSICCFSSGTYRGLKNRGATCYLNATLQVLFMTESFRERVMRSVLLLVFCLFVFYLSELLVAKMIHCTEMKNSCFIFRAPSDTNEKLVSTLNEIFQELSNQERGAPSVSTRGIIRSLGIQNGEFMMGILGMLSLQYVCVWFVCMKCVVFSL